MLDAFGVPKEPLPVDRRMGRLEIQSYALYGIVVALVVVALLFGAGQLREADRTQKALCTFRDDLVGRVKQSDDLLKRNPGLIKKFGLTEAQVKTSRDNQRRTIRSLHGLHCP